MKAIQLAKPGGLDHLKVVDLAEPKAPGPGEIRVRIHASSLNFHDFAVAAGFIPTADGRIPMADGARRRSGGRRRQRIAVGDHVVSCFSDVVGRRPHARRLLDDAGDGIDGYARERSSCPPPVHACAQG
jgi:NADPH:quinone reductase-like Zn-dependent oxidoreductase